jgi:hypothetical protein
MGHRLDHFSGHADTEEDAACCTARATTASAPIRGSAGRGARHLAHAAVAGCDIGQRGVATGMEEPRSRVRGDVERIAASGPPDGAEDAGDLDAVAFAVHRVGVIGTGTEPARRTEVVSAVPKGIQLTPRLSSTQLTSSNRPSRPGR